MRIIDNGVLGIAFVVDDDKNFVGVITDGDIRRAILDGKALTTPIKKIANASPIVIKKEWGKKKINNFLKTSAVKSNMPVHGVMKIPVLDENNRVVDIVFASEDKFESDKLEFEVKSEKIKPVNNILVVGGAGYLGSVLCRKLLNKGYMVRVLDNLTYGDKGIKDLYDNPNFEFIKGDMRNIQTDVDAIKGMDAVVHLAAIVGDPASALNPEETIEINYLGTKMLAEICKYSQINRFIFASTCSVYGASPKPDIRINEECELNPVSLYAEMKLKSEQGILELEDENFSPTILRMATLYGLSPRMRFDLVVNILTIKAVLEKKFTIFGGTQWRPNLHVNDAADAYIACLTAPLSKIKGEIFNTGSNGQNYQIMEIGNMVKDLVPSAEKVVDVKNIDERNYNISFDKIRKILDYSTTYDIKKGVLEIIEAINNNEFSDYPNKKYNNYLSLKESDINNF